MDLSFLKTKALVALNVRSTSRTFKIYIVKINNIFHVWANIYKRKVNRIITLLIVYFLCRHRLLTHNYIKCNVVANKIFKPCLQAHFVKKHRSHVIIYFNECCSVFCWLFFYTLNAWSNIFILFIKCCFITYISSYKKYTKNDKKISRCGCVVDTAVYLSWIRVCNG